MSDTPIYAGIDPAWGSDETVLTTIRVADTRSDPVIFFERFTGDTLQPYQRDFLNRLKDARRFAKLPLARKGAGTNKLKRRAQRRARRITRQHSK